jgi:hypothetical protein
LEGVEYERFFIETNYGHRKTFVLWSEEMERADFRLLTLSLQTADKAMRALVVFSKNLVASPALPTTQLGRLDYLSNMGLHWKTWMQSTGLQEKEDLSLPV